MWLSSTALCATLATQGLLAGTVVRSISMNQRITSRLKQGDAHIYRVALRHGDEVCFKAEQRGVDVSLTLLDRSRHKLREIDAFEYGTESASLRAEASGEYRLAVKRARNDAAGGEYTLLLAPSESSGALDRRIAAEMLSTEIKGLVRAKGEGTRKLALQKAMDALSRWRALGDKTAELAMLIQIGELDYALEDSGAMKYYELALPIAMALKDTRSEGEIYNDIGMVQWQADSEPGKALSSLNRALELWRGIGYEYGEAAALSNRGILLVQIGNMRDALRDYFRALHLIRRLADVRGQAFITNNIGAAYSWLGNSTAAIRYLERAVRLFRISGDSTAAGRAMLTVGRIHMALGRNREAYTCARRAVAAVRAGEDRQWETEAWSVIGRVWEGYGRTGRALAVYDEALALARSIGYLRGQAGALHNQGVLLSHLGRHKEAIASLREALAIRQDLGLREGEADTSSALSVVESRRENFEAARSLAESSVQLTESLRSDIGGDQLRAAYLGSRLSRYEQLIDVLMRMHEIDTKLGLDRNGFEVSERMRARSLLETLGETRDEAFGVPALLLASLRRANWRLNLEAFRLAQAADGTAPERAAIQARLSERLAEYREIETEIRTANPHYATLTQVEPLSLAQIQKELVDSDDTLLLEYVLGRERSYVWAVGRDFIHSYVLPPRQIVVDAVGRLNALASTTFYRRPSQRRLEDAARDLSRILLNPVAAELKASRILIVGDNVFQSLPFAALQAPGTDSKRYVPLMNNHEIVSLPSASTLVLQRREFANRPPAAHLFAVLGDPVFDKADGRVKQAAPASGQPMAPDAGRPFRRLLHSRREVQVIWHMLPPSGNLKAVDFAASKELVLSGALEDYRYIHVSTHAQVNREEPALSGLVLSLVDERGQSRDGFLRLNDIYNLKLSADVVVLSACETIAGPSIPGEGIIGLTRAFMHAGAHSVLASLWRVDAGPTAELMSRFYKGILGPGHLRPAMALRAAQIDMWKNGWNPADWAGFVLSGDW